MSEQCARPGCSEDVADHLLACRDDWFALPVPIRNKVTLAYQKLRRSGGRHGKVAYRRALLEAVRVWGASAVVLGRCHDCGELTDVDEVLEDGTVRPVCLKCFKKGVGPTPLRECSSCGHPTDSPVSFSDRPPHLCLECAELFASSRFGG